MPIQIVSNRPGMTIHVNDQPITLLLDTGAPMGLMLSGSIARAASVVSAPAPGFAMAGVMGAVESELSEAARLHIGPFEFENVPVAVAPKGWFNLGYPGDSVVGYDLLSQFTVRLDYRNGRMWLRREPGDARDLRRVGLRPLSGERRAAVEPRRAASRCRWSAREARPRGWASDRET